MSAREQILAANDDLKSEVIVVPEWNDVKVIVRELNVAARSAYFRAITDKVETASGYELVPNYEGLADVHLVIASLYEEDGTKVFGEEHVDALAQRAVTPVGRLADVARRLSGLDQEGPDEAGKASDPTRKNSSFSD